MPELPEIETLKNSLEQKLIGLTINGLQLRRESLRYKLSTTLATEIYNSRIISLRRRAKYLLLDLDNSYSLVIHLGMSGNFTICPSNYQIKKHDHVILCLNNNQKLVFNDARRFGMIYCYKTNDLEKKLFSNLAIEPLSTLFTNKYLHNKIATRKIPIKNLLMNNKIVVGIGNIYASESLFLAKIHPSKLGVDLSFMEINNLIIAIKEVLLKAIQAGGTTLKDFVHGDNSPGYFQQQLLVYNRENQQCVCCKSMITKMKQAGRSSFYCSSCQI